MGHGHRGRGRNRPMEKDGNEAKKIAQRKQYVEEHPEVLKAYLSGTRKSRSKSLFLALLVLIVELGLNWGFVQNAKSKGFLPATYSVEYSLTDTLVVSVLHWLVWFALVAKLYLSPGLNLKEFFTVIYWIYGYTAIVVVGKAVAFDWSPIIYTSFARAVMAITLVSSLLLAHLTDRIFIEHKDVFKILKGELEIPGKYRKGHEETGAQQPAAAKEEDEDKVPEMEQLSKWELAKLLKPYFWPDGWMNRIRCMLTFVFLGGSKVCSLMAPIFVGRAVQKLTNGTELRLIYIDLVAYTCLNLGTRLLKEGQNYIYIRVKQVAFTEVAGQTF